MNNLKVYKDKVLTKIRWFPLKIRIILQKFNNKIQQDLIIMLLPINIFKEKVN